MLKIRDWRSASGRHACAGRPDVAVAEHLEVQGVDVIDAAGCIVTPGFIDGHSHCWQSLLRGFASDWSFPQYMNERAMLSGCYDEDAAYLTNLLGGLQSIDAGITTIVDHSHLQKSPEVSHALARGLIDSGVGGFFCYALQNATDFLGDSKIDSEAISDLLIRPADEWHYANAERVRRTFFDGSRSPLRFGVALYEAQPMYRTKMRGNCSSAQINSSQPS